MPISPIEEKTTVYEAYGVSATVMFKFWLVAEIGIRGGISSFHSARGGEMIDGKRFCMTEQYRCIPK